MIGWLPGGGRCRTFFAGFGVSLMMDKVLLFSDFGTRLAALNPKTLAALVRWVFHPGMLFSSLEQWWNPNRPRAVPHEGLDLCCFAEPSGALRWVPPDLSVPPFLPGRVVRMAPDFLGISIFLGHDLCRAGLRLHSALGHTKPRADLRKGDRVEAHELVAHLAPPRGRRPKVPPHLHLSLFWLPDKTSSARLDWRTLGSDPIVHLLNPLPLLNLPYTIQTLPVPAGLFRSPGEAK